MCNACLNVQCKLRGPLPKTAIGQEAFGTSAVLYSSFTVISLLAKQVSVHSSMAIPYIRRPGEPVTAVLIQEGDDIAVRCAICSHCQGSL